jgi:Family of unknown function (DUF6264)
MSVASVVAFAVSTGNRMSDPRPRPEYGEYASPEEQAAAMGRAYIPPVDSAAPALIPQPVVHPSGMSLRSGGSLIDRFVTILQLGIGLVLLLTSDFFHLGENANIDLAEFGVSQRIPVAIDRYGWLLLAANIVLLLATFAWAYARLRRGRLAFWVPVIGYLAFSVVLGVVLSILH